MNGRRTGLSARVKTMGFNYQLPTLSYRRIPGDMIELYKIITGKYDSDCSLRLYLRSVIVYASIARGNKLKLVPQHCKYDLRKHYFTNRVVSIWNSLPNDMVMADNINLFKNHLDKFWSSCEFAYSYRAQPFGTGSVK